MKLMKTTPARLPSASIRHASPPGPSPRPAVPFVRVKSTSVAATGLRPAVFTGRGFGVGRSGRRRFDVLLGVLFLALIEEAEAALQPLVRTLPVLRREEAGRVRYNDVLDAGGNSRCRERIRKFIYSGVDLGL